MKRRMFETFKNHLEMTEDESDFAVEEAYRALKLLDDKLEAMGKEILEEMERENRIAILMIGRPYHSDPGLNHSIMDEFQVLGYPILSMKSIPKDPAWLERFFRDDLQKKRISHVMDINDVWPENYSANSVQKVWSAKFASRHPNVAVLDLSSFKCGHDAPTYGLIDSMISAAGTPYSALHDIDANKPGGSIKIRVRTYAHTLSLHEERLQDLAAKRTELQRRVAEKRRELVLQRERAIAARSGTAGASVVAMDAAYRDYLAEDPVLPAFSEERL